MPSAVGRYRIDRVLGSGAFASVWLAHDEVLDAQVAVKVLTGGLIDDLDVRNRFLDEARILRRADSERLVRVHDIGELPDGRPYFVMSYADLGTLADRMRRRRMSLAEALEVAAEVARGVEVINRLGIIHRDLKPSNVLFQSTTDGGERLLLADLGLAKALAHASGAFTLPVGTPGYMSPEQARFGGGLDVRADVYGLGALTYHLVTGRAPSTAPVATPPSAVQPGLPPEIDEVVMRALEFDRERRWPSAEAYAAALAGPIAAASTSAPPSKDHHDPTLANSSTRDATMADVSGGRRPDLPTTPDSTAADQPSSGYRTPPDSPAYPRPPDPSGQPRSQESGYPAPPGSSGGPSAYGPSGPVGPGSGAPPSGTPNDRTPSMPPPYEPTQQRGRSQPEEPSDRTVVDFPVGRPDLAQDATVKRGAVEGDATVKRGSAADRGGAGEAAAKSGAEAAPEARAGETRRGRVFVALGLAALLVAGGGGAYAIAKLTGSGSSKPKKANDGLVGVTDTTGRLSLRVPPAWKLQKDRNKWPIQVSDAATAPALRATPDYGQFVRDDAAVPGVFAGLTHDLKVKLPPDGLGSHNARCKRGTDRPYRHGTLSGQITPWTCSGSITINEVGLRDSGGKYAMWVRVKLTGPPDITTKILDSIQTKG